VLQHIMPANTLITPATYIYYWRVIRTVNGIDNIPNISRRIYVGALGTGPTGSPMPNPINNPSYLVWSADAVPPPNITIDAYEVAVSKSLTFTPLLAPLPTVTGLSVMFTPAAGQNGVLHYFRVRGLNNNLPVTGWGPTTTFKVDNVAPVKPVITPPVAPVVSAPGTFPVYGTLRPAFAWTAVPTATRYRVAIFNFMAAGYVDLDESSANTYIIVNAPFVSFTPGVNLPQTTLRLEVSAEDGVNTSLPSTLDFNVALGTTPAQNATLTATPPQYVWPTVSGATSYTLQVANDSSFIAVRFTKTDLTSLFYTPTPA
jgi:hypothetical protein